MNPWAIMGGAALGVLKGRQDQKDYQDEGKLASTMTRFSPWTGMKGTLGKKPSMMGSVMQGALTGASMGQKMGGGEGAAEEVAEDEVDADDGAQLTGGEVGGLSGPKEQWGVPQMGGEPREDYVSAPQAPGAPQIASSPGSTYSMKRRGRA